MHNALCFSVQFIEFSNDAPLLFDRRNRNRKGTNLSKYDMRNHVAPRLRVHAILDPRRTQEMNQKSPIKTVAQWLNKRNTNKKAELAIRIYVARAPPRSTVL